MSELPYTLPRLLPGDSSLTGEVDATGGLDDGTLAEIAELCAQSQNLLIKQYEDSEKLRALVCALIDPIQALETATLAVYNQVLNIDAAEGVHLDLLGRIVREARNGLSDYVYRRAIKTRILINRSQGRARDFIAIARMFEDMDGGAAEVGSFVSVRDVQPARVEIRVIHTPASEPREVHKRLRQAKAAGVALTSMLVPYPATFDRAFRLIRAADYMDPAADDEHGLGLAADPSYGGTLLHALSGAV